MTINCLHHINIQTDKLEQTRDFYERVLGLYVGARPDFGQMGYWLVRARFRSSHRPFVAPQGARDRTRHSMKATGSIMSPSLATIWKKP